METLHNCQDLADLIEKQISRVSHKLVFAIDGYSGAGKSKVAAFLEQCLSIAVLHCDDYFQKDGKFLQTFRLHEFVESFDQMHKKSHVLVEGMLLEDIFSRLHTKPDFKIYVKRTNRYGFWFDGTRLNESPSQTKNGSFHYALIEYHLRVKPHETANCILELVEE